MERSQWAGKPIQQKKQTITNYLHSSDANPIPISIPTPCFATPVNWSILHSTEPPNNSIRQRCLNEDSMETPRVTALEAADSENDDPNTRCASWTKRIFRMTKWTILVEEKPMLRGHGVDPDDSVRQMWMILCLVSSVTLWRVCWVLAWLMPCSRMICGLIDWLLVIEDVRQLFLSTISGNRSQIEKRKGGKWGWWMSPQWFSFGWFLYHTFSLVSEKFKENRESETRKRKHETRDK